MIWPTEMHTDTLNDKCEWGPKHKKLLLCLKRCLGGFRHKLFFSPVWSPFPFRVILRKELCWLQRRPEYRTKRLITWFLHYGVKMITVTVFTSSCFTCAVDLNGLTFCITPITPFLWCLYRTHRWQNRYTHNQMHLIHWLCHLWFNGIGVQTLVCVKLVENVTNLWLFLTLVFGLSSLVTLLLFSYKK